MKHLKQFLPLFLLLIAATASAQIATDGLVGYWKMDPANSGLGPVLPPKLAPNTGAIYGSPLPVFDPVMGPALRFDGTFGYFADGPDEWFRPQTGTLEVWAYPDGQQHADLVTKVDSYRLSYGLSILSNGAIRGAIAQAAPQDELVYKFLVFHSPGGQVIENRWQQLVLRWDGSTVAIFQNGHEVSKRRYNSGEQGLVYGLQNQGFYIGFQTVWGRKMTPAFSGMIGPVRLYERALSDDEIFANFQFTAGAAN